jgi:hypothetical protein
MAEMLDHADAPKVLADPVSAWTNLHKLYPVYCDLVREFSLEIAACRELEQVAGTEEGLRRAEAWVAEIDDRIHVHQLRQFLQTSPTATGEILHELLLHHWAKSRHGASDRDKLDFLAVQYLFERAPDRALGPDFSLERAGEVLRPVVGRVACPMPEWLAPLDELLAKSLACRSLNELFTARIIEQGREIKSGSGEQFFSPAALVAFARFGFLLRRIFFRLMHEDLNRILEALCQLEAQGVSTLDCRKAQFSSEERVARLRMICQSWRVMFQAEYSSGQALCILVDLRTAVEAALVEAARLSGASAKAKALRNPDSSW